MGKQQDRIGHDRKQAVSSGQCGLPTLPKVPEVQVVCSFVCVYASVDMCLPSFYV